MEGDSSPYAAVSDYNPKHAALALFVMGGLVLLIGAAGLWAAASLAASGEASTDWDAVKGHVVESGVETRADIGASELRQAFEERTYEHFPRVRYAYTVDGEAYTADRLRFGEKNWEPGDRGRERAQAEADHYPEGADVIVHYDPSDPGEAVLEPGRQSTPWMIGVGGIALLGGLAMLWAGARARRREAL